MKNRLRKLAASIMGGAFCVLTAAFTPSANAQDGGELVLGLAGSPPTLLSAVQSGFGTGQPGPQLFASPLRYDKGWEPQPYLAKSWIYSDDGLKLTLKLVENATFHDGEPIEAHDVAFSIMAIKANHPFKTMLAPVERVEAVDKHTAVIHLKHKHPALLLAMSPVLMPIMPEHIYGGAELRGHPRGLKDVVGSGPYVLEEFVADQHIILNKNPNFFIEGRPKLDRLVYRTVRDRSNMLLALQRGEIHYNAYTSLTLRDVGRIKSKKGDLVATDAGYQGVGPLNWIAFNTKRKPWTDKRVRQAIAYAVDKDFIIDKMQLGLSNRATGPIANDSPFYTSDVPSYDHNPEKAKALLDEVGFKPDGNGVRMNINIDWIPGSTEYGKNVGEAVKAQLKKVGVNATVRSLPDFGSWIGRIAATNDYDLSLETVFNWGDPVVGVHRTYITSNIRKGVPFSNTSLYSNTKVDEILEKAAVEADSEKRTALYHEFQKAIAEDVPLHYLHVVPYFTVHNSRLKGLPEGVWGGMAPFDRAHWTK